MLWLLLLILKLSRSKSHLELEWTLSNCKISLKALSQKEESCHLSQRTRRIWVLHVSVLWLLIYLCIQSRIAHSPSCLVQCCSQALLSHQLKAIRLQNSRLIKTRFWLLWMCQTSLQQVQTHNSDRQYDQQTMIEGTWSLLDTKQTESSFNLLRIFHRQVPLFSPSLKFTP